MAASFDPVAYNPATGTWALTGSMTTPREHQAATLLNNGEVLVSGGENASGTALASAELYNPATGKWAATGSMSTPREGHDATLLPDGDVLVTAGVETAGVFSELYNPSTGQWSAAAGGLAACGTATECRFGSTAVLLGTGNVLVTGGLACPAPSSTPLTAAPGAWVAPSQAPGALTPGNRQSQGRGSVQPALKF